MPHLLISVSDSETSLAQSGPHDITDQRTTLTTCAAHSLECRPPLLTPTVTAVSGTATLAGRAAKSAAAKIAPSRCAARAGWPACLPPRDGECGSATEMIWLLRLAALPGVELLRATVIRHRRAAHLHENWTVGVVDRGVMTLVLEGASYQVPAGAAFVIPPQAVHTDEPGSPRGYSYSAVHLDPALSPGRLPEPLTTRPRHRVPEVISNPVLVRHLSLVHRVAVVPGAGREARQAVAEVIRELASLVHAHRGEPRELHHGVDRAVAYIRAHWREDFTIAELAEAARISPFHLIRSFGQHVGITPAAYRRALRVLAARRMLAAGRTPAEATAECGFYDQSHLTRHFKAAIGVTPRQYLLSGR